jgi:hypothetical protein
MGILGQIKGQSTHTVPLPRVWTPPCALVISKEILSSHFNRVKSMRPTFIRRLQVKGDTFGWPNTAMASDPIIIWYLRRHIYEKHTSMVMNLISLVYLFGTAVIDRASMSRSCLTLLHNGCQGHPLSLQCIIRSEYIKLEIVLLFRRARLPVLVRRLGLAIRALETRHTCLASCRAA